MFSFELLLGALQKLNVRGDEPTEAVQGMRADERERKAAVTVNVCHVQDAGLCSGEKLSAGLLQGSVWCRAGRGWGVAGRAHRMTYSKCLECCMFYKYIYIGEDGWVVALLDGHLAKLFSYVRNKAGICACAVCYERLQHRAPMKYV